MQARLCAVPGRQERHFRHTDVSLWKKRPRGQGRQTESPNAVQGDASVWLARHAEHGRHGAFPPGEKVTERGQGWHSASRVLVHGWVLPLPGAQSLQGRHLNPSGE